MAAHSDIWFLLLNKQRPAFYYAGLKYFRMEKFVVYVDFWL